MPAEAASRSSARTRRKRVGAQNYYPYQHGRLFDERTMWDGISFEQFKDSVREAFEAFEPITCPFVGHDKCLIGECEPYVIGVDTSGATPCLYVEMRPDWDDIDISCNVDQAFGQLEEWYPDLFSQIPGTFIKHPDGDRRTVSLKAA
jgi:hypothetical protein